ncbi:MAG: hypothetical protein LUH58_11490 [Lachnospiraceae bacterium]|nr:hypothetical protein [Lachnospiraceae bacterium]
MLYMHYCQNCHYIHMLNGHRTACPTCSMPLKELSISYLDYSALDREERKALCRRLDASTRLMQNASDTDAIPQMQSQLLNNPVLK